MPKSDSGVYNYQVGDDTKEDENAAKMTVNQYLSEHRVSYAIISHNYPYPMPMRTRSAGSKATP